VLLAVLRILGLPLLILIMHGLLVVVVVVLV
jgi:hypothetical protein